MSLIEEAMNHPRNKEPLSKKPRTNVEICITIEKKKENKKKPITYFFLIHIAKIPSYRFTKG